MEEPKAPKEQEQQENIQASDFEFLQEKIKERPIDKKKLIQRTIITASLALLFGLIACLTFLVLEPVLNNWIYPEEEPEIVTFTQEEDEMLPEDMLTELPALPGNPPYGFPPVKPPLVSLVSPEKPPLGGDGISPKKSPFGGEGMSPEKSPFGGVGISPDGSFLPGKLPFPRPPPGKLPPMPEAEPYIT